MRATTRLRDEQGAVMVLFALFITAIFAMVAIVIDLAGVREDRRTNKLIADQAASAGSSNLDENPWSAACKALDYLRANTPALRTGTTVTYKNGSGSTVSNPCANPAAAAPCTAGNPATFARIKVTSGNGNLVAEIKAAYTLPDADFPEDSALLVADEGDGPCLHMGVIISEKEDAKFSAVMGADPITSRMRSVARLMEGEQQGQSAALQLLERHDCNVLVSSGSNTKVVALAHRDALTNTYAPGVIQFDTAGDSPSCNSGNPIINGQSTTTGPSILACSVTSVFTHATACGPNEVGSPSTASRIGVYAQRFASVPASNISRDYSVGTYGDTDRVASGQATRVNVDERYRSAVYDLDRDAHAALCSTVWPGCATPRTLPQGCSTLVGDTCTDTSGTVWKVITGAACTAPPATIAEVKVFFACPDLNITTGVAMPAATDIVIAGKLRVSASTFSAPLVKRTYVLGTEPNPGTGLDVATGGVLDLNRGGRTSCAQRTLLDPESTSRFVLGRGSLDVTATMKACSTTVLLSSGFGKIPSTDGTAPCPSTENATACASYKGVIVINAGANIDWSAPNREKSIPECPHDTACYDPALEVNELEDLALWVEAAGGSQGIKKNLISGGSATNMAGVYFLPNADEFTLAGGGSLPIQLNAQFVTRKLTVTGGATVALRPNPTDSVSLPIFTNVLIR